MQTELSSIDREGELLLICARNRPDVSRGRLEELLSEGPDWQYLLKAADRHGLLPLLYRTLREAQDQVPPAVLSDLRRSYLFNSQRNHLLTGELLRLLERFEAEGILAIPFKGPVLSQELYGDVAFRMFTDLDVLVRREDILRAKEILISEGYSPENILTEAQERVFLRSGHHYHFYNQKSVHLEVHWQVSPSIYCFPLTTKDIFSRAARKVIFGKELLTVSPEDLLLVLCEHGARHYWRRLAWIGDLDRLVESKRIDWRAVASRSERMGCYRLLLLGLFLANGLLCTPLPLEISIHPHEETKVAHLVEETATRLLARDAQIEAESRLPDIGEELLYLRAKERLRDKAGYYIRRATTPTTDDWSSMPLPGQLAPLYYVLRPVRLMNKYGIGIRRWLKRE
ncbi:putative nucleotidyltransferase [uncultured archaeon]|nr:putative nucleotidyltransferase [uncultured archaeon]